ncbi:alpha/beta hydrolase [Dactylosporangium sp. AC04546]|uniref:alpha/beta fold hydrolase n=1 Tax=Dactylosporangium sp. AC04546 TaxID=2862460 RepID=UPI001EDD10DE|nr:alpha/beta hydrolase [Dactylosporangium sp. AC04546]WVK80762.1 alpha/beta hydrolase [Dactylosporangium sp. AC04546]
MDVFTAPIETVIVDGCPIRFRQLGSREGEPVVLVHGGAAHHGWWSAVAPRLARRRHVIVPDLSGHGDSGHRGSYAAEAWADDIIGVLDATTAGPATLVGHSMGGLVAICTAARVPDRILRLVLVDTRIPLRRLPPPNRLPRWYASEEEALGSFRLRPAGSVADPTLLRRVARAGLRHDEQGWRWKLDPKTRRLFTDDIVEAALLSLRCPVGYVYGEHSELVDEEVVDHVASKLRTAVPRVRVPRAFHHVPLDDPDACTAAIEELAAPRRLRL